MKTVALLLLFAFMISHVVGMPQGLGFEQGHPLGCTHKQEERNSFECMRNFYRALQKNPGTTCKDHLDDYITCMANNSLKCSGVKDKDINLYIGMAVQGMKAGGAIDGMQKAICDFYAMPGISGDHNCNSAGKLKSMECMQNFRAKFLKNRNDRGFCRAYHGAMACAVDARQKYCPGSMTDHEREEALSKMNNPFC